MERKESLILLKILQKLNKYRYGFNGKEKESEIGEGVYDFGARISDSRLGGRFFSIDPDAIKYPFMSPYCFAANNPIYRLRW